MSFSQLINDHCTIQNRTADTTGKSDTETFTAQATPTRCRVITQVSRRRSGASDAEKLQYATLVYTTFALPKTASIGIHDRIAYPVTNGQTFDVIAVIQARDAKGVRHLVAQCEGRA